MPPSFYMPYTAPAQSRGFLLQSLSGALAHLSQVLSAEQQQQHYHHQQQQQQQFGGGLFPPFSAAPASVDEGARRVQAWQEKVEEIVRRAGRSTATSNRRSLSSSSSALSTWERKARALASMLEKTNQGARAALGAAEGLLDLEESRPDMRWILPQTDAQDASLCGLVSHHQAALAVVLGKRKALAACLGEVGEAKGQMAALEKEANALGRKMMEVGQKRRAWMQEEHGRQRQVKEGLRYLAAELRDRPSASSVPGASSSPPAKGSSSSSSSNTGTRLLDVGMLKAVVRATHSSSFSSAPRAASSALQQVHDDAQFLLQSVHALEAEAGAVAVMLESSCGGSTSDPSQGAEEEQRPEAWAAALESMLEGLEGMGGEAQIQALGDKFRTCIEELQDLAEDANDAAALVGAGGEEGGEGGEDQEEEDEEEEEVEDQVEGEEEHGNAKTGGKEEKTAELPPHSPSPNVAVLHPSTAAVGALRKVQAKLEGRSGSSSGGDGARALGVNEQVDAWVREATDPNRLCVLFEGWMPFL